MARKPKAKGSDIGNEENTVPAAAERPAHVLTHNAIFTFLPSQFDPVCSFATEDGDGVVSVRVPRDAAIVDARKTPRAVLVGQRRVDELRTLLSRAKQGDTTALVSFLKKYRSVINHPDVRPTLELLAASSRPLASLLRAKAYRGRPLANAAEYAEVQELRRLAPDLSFEKAAKRAYELRRKKRRAVSSWETFLREAKKQRKKCEPYWLPERIDLNPIQQK